MKTSKQQRMYAAIQKHGEQLNAIFNTPFEPIELCKKLRRIELAQHRANEDYCNAAIDRDQWEKVTEQTRAKLTKLLGDSIPLEIGGDPRGYACRINDEVARMKSLILYRDFGGNCILAADFSEA